MLTNLRMEYWALPDKVVRLNMNGRDHCYVKTNDQLFGVFANLINNAIKHTGNHADILIRLGHPSG